VTITRQDVQALSSAPGPGGIALPRDQADRVAAVLNAHSSDRPASRAAEASQPNPPGPPCPEDVDEPRVALGVRDGRIGLDVAPAHRRPYVAR
jgi:hypothetical protein